MSNQARVTFTIKGPSSAKISQVVERALERGFDNLRNEVERQWMKSARAKLDTTLDTYMNRLSVLRGNDSVEAQLSGWLPVALEVGTKRFDMKPGLLAGRQSRVIPMHDGKFRTVGTWQPKGSWWHPGFTPRAIHKDVEDTSDEMVKRSFGSVFDRIKV